MKKSQKRTCNGCRALSFDRSWAECFFGYKIDQKDIRPKEPCEKPLTNMEHCKLTIAREKGLPV